MKANVLCVISDLGLGGAQKNLIAVAKWLTEEGAAVSLLTLRQVVPEYHDVPEGVQRIQVPSMPSARWFDLASQWHRLRWLRRSISTADADILISFVDLTNVLLLLCTVGLDVRVVVSERVDPAHHHIGGRWSLLRRLLYPRAARVVLVARDSIRWASSRWPRWRVEWIPNAVEATVRIPPENYDVPVIVTAGRLVNQKGFDLLIKAFAKVAGTFPEWRLTIFGEGPERERLVSLITALRLSDRVSVRPPPAGRGWLSEKASIFALPSRYEGFPNVLAEAMARGLAVVTYDCPGGPSMLVKHGFNGFLVPPQDVDEFSRYLGLLMGDLSLRRSVGAAGTGVTVTYSAEQVKTRWISLLQAVLGDA